MKKRGLKEMMRTERCDRCGKVKEELIDIGNEKICGECYEKMGEKDIGMSCGCFG